MSAESLKESPNGRVSNLEMKKENLASVCTTKLLVLRKFVPAFFFPRTRKGAVYHLYYKKKWDKNPYKTHPLTPVGSY